MHDILLRWKIPKKLLW